MPPGTTPGQLAGLGMGVGLMSAGIGSVPASQTLIDIGQGARLNPSLYDGPAPRLRVAGGMTDTPHVPRALWDRVRDRARSAPADLVPGLLGSSVTRAGVATGARPPGQLGAAILAGEDGSIGDGRCPQPGCPRVGVRAVDLGGLNAMLRRLGRRDLVIAIERPAPAPNHALTIGTAGSGLRGTLTSDSTRMRGFVLSTDLAPTLLQRLGIAEPDQVDGRPISARGRADPGLVDQLEARLAVIGPRRGPVIGASLLLWTGLAALAGLALGRRGLRVALPALAVTVAYLPAVLLLTAALEPSELAERLIAAIGSPALALLTLRLAGAYGALAIAGAVSVIGYGTDLVAGSALTEVSLMGPNPVGGVRFFGIGNELEAMIAGLVPIATGAALVAWAPRATPGRAALAFVIAGVAAVAAFAPGRFGADVGAAISIPVGVGVAVAVCLERRWRHLALIAAPIVALAALAAADLLLGGDAHLYRSVLHAGGFEQLGDVVERRIRLSAANFERYASTAMLWAAALAIVAGIWGRRRIHGWFGRRRDAWAGFLGAAAATVAGALANDSGALVLMVGTALVTLAAGVAWATSSGRADVSDTQDRVR
jgi:hypothetical protein